MSGLRTAALGAACSLLLVACSTKPAGDGSASSTVDTGSVSAGASSASIDSAARATPAATSPATDTAHPATPPATPAASGAATTSPAPAAGTGSAGKTTAPGAPRPNATTRSDSARASKAAPAAASPSTQPAAAAPAAGAVSRAAPSAPPTSPAAAAAPGSQSAPVKVNKFMSYDAAAKTVTLEIIAAYNSVQGGFNFNGGSNGSHTITVPAGWQVTMHVKNVDAIPHSAIVIADQRPLPNAPDSPAIPRAYTSHVNDGLQPQNGADDLSFRASKPGKYLIYCGVPGHGPSGMFIDFVVSESATVPSYQM